MIMFFTYLVQKSKFDGDQHILHRCITLRVRVMVRVRVGVRVRDRVRDKVMTKDKGEGLGYVRYKVVIS
jgi:hypothetical protein